MQVIGSACYPYIQDLMAFSVEEEHGSTDHHLSSISGPIEISSLVQETLGPPGPGFCQIAISFQESPMVSELVSAAVVILIAIVKTIANANAKMPIFH